MALQGLLREFLSTRCVRDMQALESLVGHLVHATKVCPIVLSQPDRHLYTDTLGSWGCGAWSLPAWLQVHWPTSHCLSSIALKELVPVVLAATVWAERWGGQLILCHS